MYLTGVLEHGVFNALPQSPNLVLFMMLISNSNSLKKTVKIGALRLITIHFFYFNSDFEWYALCHIPKEKLEKLYKGRPIDKFERYILKIFCAKQLNTLNQGFYRETSIDVVRTCLKKMFISIIISPRFLYPLFQKLSVLGFSIHSCFVVSTFYIKQVNVNVDRESGKNRGKFLKAPWQKIVSICTW